MALLPWTWGSRPAWFGLGLLAAIGIGAVYFVDPRVAGNYPPCPFLYLTGCYCPGCGTLRAIHRLLHADLRGAIGYNALTVVLIPFLAVGVGDRTARLCGRALLPASTMSPQVAWVTLIAIIAFWALRNVPLHPFTALAP